MLVFGAPVLVTVLAILIFAAFTESFLWTAVGAALTGILTRGVLYAYGIIRYRVDTGDGTQRVNEVAVTATALEDADGEPLFVTKVDGYELAHRDAEQLADVTSEAVTWRLEGPDVDASNPPRNRPALEHYYYQRAIGNGDVDLDDVFTSYRGDVATRIKATLAAKGGEAYYEDILPELHAEYPEQTIGEAVRFLERTGQVYENQGKWITR